MKIPPPYRTVSGQSRSTFPHIAAKNDQSKPRVSKNSQSKIARALTAAQLSTANREAPFPSQPPTVHNTSQSKSELPHAASQNSHTKRAVSYQAALLNSQSKFDIPKQHEFN